MDGMCAENKKKSQLIEHVYQLRFKCFFCGFKFYKIN